MWSDPLSFFQEAAGRYGPVVRIDFGSRAAFLLNDPADIKYVLLENNQNYRKSSTVPIVKKVLGRGLATNEGDSWLAQRRLMQPAFHRQQIGGLGQIMVAEAEQLLDRWRGIGPELKIDLLAEMMHLTLRIVLRTMFGHDLQGNINQFGQAWSIVLEEFNRRSWSLVQLPDSWPTPANRRFQRALQLLDDEVYRMISGRRHTPTSTHDLLGLLLAAQDAESGQGMSDQQLRDEVMTVFLAGHETTANALTWAWYLLAQNPDAAAKLRVELKDVLAGRSPTIADLPQLPYTRMVIDETLRLYPPFWLIYRSPYQPDTVGGYPLAANGMIFISPYLVHRNPAYWSRPEQFQPERFTPEQNSHRPPFHYFPFGGGPHQCIGNNMALLEAQLILATMAQTVAFQVPAGAKITPEASVTLRPKGGLPLQFKAT